MRRFHMVVIALLVVLTSLPSGASTLDPSHPLWSRSDLDRTRWMDALAQLAHDRAPGLKQHVPQGARGRIAAVGRRVLVIPVLPSDAAAPPVDTSTLQQLWNGTGESSVSGYWDYVSSGELRLEVRVLPWLRVPGTLVSDYPNVINGNPSNLTAGPRNLARDALTAAARTVEDLNPFDDDGPDGMPGSGDDDGVLDLVVVLHPFPGWETDPGPVERAIVSVQSRLGGEPIAGTDLRADGFVVTSATGPLGVWVHEFGHLLGLPDLYDLDRSPLEGTPGDLSPQGGLGRWSLMASGTWGGEGSLPSGLDAWSRDALGFGETVDLDMAGQSGLPWVDSGSARTIRLYPLGDWGEEIFLVEARRARPEATVDAALPGSGALVYRVRSDLPSNTISAKFVELLQADGRDDLGSGANDGDESDPFDGIIGRDRLDGTTTPSSQSWDPSTLRTPPALEFRRRASGMEVDFALSSGAALRLETFGVGDGFLGVRPWLRPGETGELLVAFSDVGADPASGATLTVRVLPEGRPLEVEPAGAVALVEGEGTLFVPDSPITLTEPLGGAETGVALLELEIAVPASKLRTIRLGLPVSFSGGLPDDAMARFDQTIVAAPTDTTRFARLSFVDLPQPASVGYELRTDGLPGYANGVEVSLLGPWFGVPPEQQAWVWERGSTEAGLPGQVFDGAAVEILYPDRGWRPLIPEGQTPAWISRRSTAATRDRLGFGGEAPGWRNWRLTLPRADLPARLRVRFGSDGSITAGTWQVAGLQTEAYPRAEITLDSDRSNAVIATARLSGDLSRVNLASYRYRMRPDDAWKPASANFTIIGSETLSIPLSLLPDTVERAEIGLLSGLAEDALLLGTAGYRRAPSPRLPTLLHNPARGVVVLQSPDLVSPLPLSVYDLRGRRRARVTIPAQTAWVEWEPRDDHGNVLPSGQYFLRSDGTEPGTVRFTWFR
jgi:M6 family metalloprotease-like protein